MEISGSSTIKTAIKTHTSGDGGLIRKIDIAVRNGTVLRTTVTLRV